MWWGWRLSGGVVGLTGLRQADPGRGTGWGGSGKGEDSKVIKLDDTTPDHPKVDGLSNAAFRAWIEALCYCSEYLTDGVISRHRIGRRDGAKVVAELISVGLVKETDDPERVVIHDYLEHQTSRQQVVDIRAKRARAGSKGGANG